MTMVFRANCHFKVYVVRFCIYCSNKFAVDYLSCFIVEVCSEVILNFPNGVVL